MIEVLSFTVVHDMQHPKEVEDTPELVSTLENLASHRAYVDVRLLRVIEDDPIDWHAPTAELEGRFALEQFDRRHVGLVCEIGKRSGLGFPFADSLGHDAA